MNLRYQNSVVLAGLELPQSCVGGLAHGGWRVGVGFARIWFVCESVLVVSRES